MYKETHLEECGTCQPGYQLDPPTVTVGDAVVVQNIENGKLHRQVDSVDAGLNRDSQ